MALECGNLGGLPAVGKNRQFKAMGSSVQSTPDVGKNTFSKMDSINSLFMQVQTAMAPMKAIFDLVESVTAILKAIQAIPDAIQEADPELMADALRNAVNVVEVLAQYIPQISFVPTMLDTVRLTRDGLDVVRTTLQQLQDQIDAVEELRQEAEETGNECLAAQADQLEQQNEVSRQHSSAILGAILKPLELVTEIAQLLPAPPNFPEIPDFTDLPLEDMIDALEEIDKALALIAP